MDNSKIMKICHVINSLNRGGAESHLLDLINAQLNDGMDVHVTVIGEDSTESYSIESELLKNGINITRLNGPRMFNLFSYFSMYLKFRNEKFDVIHSHQPRSDFMVYRINKYLSKKSKWIVSVHGKYDTYLEKGSLSNNLRKYFMKRLSKHWQSASSIIAISEEVKSWIENLNHELNVEVIPYWIDIKNSETFEKKGTVTLGFLGRLNVNKGIEDLLNALNSDQLKSLDFKLMIGGSGTQEYLEKLRNMIEQDKTEKVNFLGYIENRKEFFNNIDIFVFPSFSEGLGLVLLEAMSFSKICITRNILPMTNYIDEDSGYLFDDVDELSNSIVSSIQDLENNIELIQKKLFNIEKKLEKSSKENIFPELVKVYEQSI